MPLQAGSNWSEVKNRSRESRGSFIDAAGRAKTPPVVVKLSPGARRISALSDAELDRLLEDEHE